MVDGIMEVGTTAGPMETPAEMVGLAMKAGTMAPGITVLGTKKTMELGVTEPGTTKPGTTRAGPTETMAESGAMESGTRKITAGTMDGPTERNPVWSSSNMPMEDGTTEDPVMEVGPTTEDGETMDGLEPLLMPARRHGK